MTEGRIRTTKRHRQRKKRDDNNKYQKEKTKASSSFMYILPQTTYAVARIGEHARMQALLTYSLTNTMKNKTGKWDVFSKTKKNQKKNQKK